MLLHSNIIGEGKPLIILHGFLGMGDNWKTLGKQFAEQGYEVHLVDQRNHGRSFHNDAFSYELMAIDIKNYCEEKNLSSIALIGHSMGGKTAMLFAVMCPELVSKLIVADIAPKFYPQHHQTILEGLEALSKDKEALTGRKEADTFLSQYIKEVGVRQFLLKNLYWVAKGELGLRMNLPALIHHVDRIGEALPENAYFEKPTLFLRGGASNYIQEEDEDAIFSAFAKAKLITIPNVGHWLHAENPRQFYSEVIAFL
ncbi:alpha/beta fold hydrolase [uncultured Dokdonia sp.]|uniref:alpha/beta fold hydrolase n=1 Tax=uncultured Dokdonia sp. TaxID=575653 RepID=UPI0026088089|nr:alpha/beta fold hydrolase [uncultured Dokdonia sp.]